MNIKVAIASLGVLVAACQETVKDPEWLACANDLYSEACPAERRAKICEKQKADPDYKGSGVTLADCDRYFAGADGGEDDGGGDAGVPDGAVDGADAEAAECERNLDCPVLKPVCDAGACVPCANSAVCAERDATPVCADSGACVACSDKELGACVANDFVCRTGATECVECNGPAECSSPSASRCEDSACVQCREDADCGHLDGKVCDEGLCVECTPAKETTACLDTDPAPGDQGLACNPTDKTCTGQPRGSVSGCGVCVSDSECEPGSRCVQTVFGVAAHGTFCLQVAPSGLCPNGVPTKKSATSVLDVQGEYCFPAELTTSCEALLDFKDPCTRDSDCGAAGLDDGLCIGAEGAKRCTYKCSGNADCDGVVCTGPIGAKYCNPN